MLIKDHEFHSILCFQPSYRHPSDLLSSKKKIPCISHSLYFIEDVPSGLVGADTYTKVSRATLKAAPDMCVSKVLLESPPLPIFILKIFKCVEEVEELCNQILSSTLCGRLTDC